VTEGGTETKTRHFTSQQLPTSVGEFELDATQLRLKQLGKSSVGQMLF